MYSTTRQGISWLYALLYPPTSSGAIISLPPTTPIKCRCSKPVWIPACIYAPFLSMCMGCMWRSEDSFSCWSSPPTLVQTDILCCFSMACTMLMGSQAPGDAPVSAPPPITVLGLQRLPLCFWLFPGLLDFPDVGTHHACMVTTGCTARSLQPRLSVLLWALRSSVYIALFLELCLLLSDTPGHVYSFWDPQPSY